ncbi:MAG: YdcF family protein [Minisyncoccia bacterium]|jgi:uncharacterized SAM-binding protein YcdF (DUF218 family)
MTDREKFFVLLSNLPLKKGEAIFLLEGDGYNRVAHAAKLYKQGHAPKIVITGGAVKREYGSYPASELEIELLKLGIPKADIMLEETAAHTRAEADRAMEIARENGWKIILVATSAHHQYRAFLTFLKAMHAADMDIMIINAPARDLPWFSLNPWGKRADLLAEEMERIFAYQEKGDVAGFSEGIRYLERLEKASK